MARYRRIPVVIEAIEFVYNTANINKLKLFMGDSLGSYGKDRHIDAKGWLHVHTLEDGPEAQVEHIATEGDYIIKGIKGEFYPCKPDIFPNIYEKVE